MALVLRLISGIYLVLVWTIFVMVVLFMPGTSIETDQTLFRTFGVIPTHGMVVFLSFLITVGISIPAIALYAFGQVVGDVRAMTDHLGAMRRYYEPNGR